MKVSFHRLGDEAVLVNFVQEINPIINRQVHSLVRSISVQKIEGITYITPAYCSLVLAFDKNIIAYHKLILLIKLNLHKVAEQSSKSRKLYIPVCYDRMFGIDMDEVVYQTNLSAAEIVKIHTSITFSTYMIGFLPGFPYLGKLPAEMECTRKANPKLEVPKGAVGLAGLQTGIYPKNSPGGWQIIGQTPVDLVGKDLEHSYLFESGDEVCFYSISKKKHQAIIEEQEKGLFKWSNIYE